MCVAPITFARSVLNGSGSIATIARAPPMRAPWMAPEPTPPQPTTTTTSPGFTFARSTTEPKPVDRPQLIRAAARSETDGSSFTSDASLTTIVSENAPSCVIRLSGSPSRWYRHWPSLIIGPASVDMPRSQRCWRPVAHQKQRPHDGMNVTATWSPSASDVTSGPTAVTTPAPSWPPTIGNSDLTPNTSRISGATLMSPDRRCSSEWHIPAYATWTWTSWRPGGSTSISSVVHGSWSPLQTAAANLHRRLPWPYFPCTARRRSETTGASGRLVPALPRHRPDHAGCSPARSTAG